MKWLIVIGILLGGSLYPLTSDLRAAQAERVGKELSEKKEEFKRIKKKLLLEQKEKKDILRKESLIRKSVDRAQKDLYKKEKVLKKKRAGLEELKGRIRNTENRILILTRDLEETEDKLSFDLQTLYKMSQMPLEAYFFSPPSPTDLLKVDKYLRVLVAHHAQLTKTYRHELALKRSDGGKLVRNRIHWQHSISKEEKRKEKVRRFRNIEQAKLKSTLNQKAICERSITEIEKKRNFIQSLIGRLERERRSLSYKESKFAMLKGKLRLPVQGKVVSLFKEGGQNGIEIEAPIGTPVRAVLPGKVVYADWFKGFGNLMIIDHGDGIYTISANCAKLLKKRGDIVSKGEAIGQIGSPGSDGDSRFYFEIRHQDKPQDPLRWILKPQ